MFSHAPLNYCQYLTSNWLVISMYLQINYWWIELKFGCDFIMGHPGLINFGSCFTEFPHIPGLWLDKQFLSIWTQTALWIELKFGGRTHYETLQTLWTFCCHFLTSHFSSSLHAYADRLLILLTSKCLGYSSWDSSSLMGLNGTD